MRYWVIYETGDDGGWSAYSPDVPGCGAAAPTREEVEQLIREAILFHLEGMQADGDPYPVPSSQPWAEEIEVALPVAQR